MLMVPTYVGPSRIEGVGVFAARPIRTGETVWILDERFDLLIPQGDLGGLSTLHRDFLERYGYPHMTCPGILVLEFDNGRFMNHSENPNTDFRRPDMAWATRAIDEGEEITCNYADFDPSFVLQDGRQFAAFPMEDLAMPPVLNLPG